MFDDAALAKLLHCSVAINSDWTVLNVQLLQSPAVVRHILDSHITDHVTTFDAQFLQVGAVLGKHLESQVGDVTLANVQ